MNVILLVITAVTALTFLVLAIGVWAGGDSHYLPAEPGICAGGRGTACGRGLYWSLRLSDSYEVYGQEGFEKIYGARPAV